MIAVIFLLSILILELIKLFIDYVIWLQPIKCIDYSFIQSNVGLVNLAPLRNGHVHLLMIVLH